MFVQLHCWTVQPSGQASSNMGAIFLPVSPLV